MFARFDDMETPFAAMVWGRVLPLQTLDTEAILKFDQTYGERTNPEQFCSPAAIGRAVRRPQRQLAGRDDAPPRL